MQITANNITYPDYNNIIEIMSHYDNTVVFRHNYAVCYEMDFDCNPYEMFDSEMIDYIKSHWQEKREEEFVFQMTEN